MSRNPIARSLGSAESSNRELAHRLFESRELLFDGTVGCGAEFPEPGPIALGLAGAIPIVPVSQ
jgi:hypothetical protein